MTATIVVGATFEMLAGDSTHASSAGIGSGDTAPKRYTTCPECGGRGRLPDPYDRGWGGTITCSRCGGNGQIEY